MIEFATIVAGITGMVQVAKKTGLSSRYAPLLSLVLGVTLVTIIDLDKDVFKYSETLFSGIIAGLSASGLYSSTKKVVLDK